MSRSDLTLREWELLLAYCQHETVEATAEYLKIGPQTVKNHLTRIYKKIGVRKAHAAVYRLGLTAPSVATTTETSSNHDVVELWIQPDDTFVNVDKFTFTSGSSSNSGITFNIERGFHAAGDTNEANQ